MRIVSLFAFVLIMCVPTLASAQTQVGPIAVLSGGAVRANFDHTSADGCEHTFGEILILKAYTDFYLANGLYLNGLRDNLCTGEFNAFAGYTEGKFDIVALAFAHFEATLVAESYWFGDPHARDEWQPDATASCTVRIANSKRELRVSTRRRDRCFFDQRKLGDLAEFFESAGETILSSAEQFSKMYRTTCGANWDAFEMTNDFRRNFHKAIVH